MTAVEGIVCYLEKLWSEWKNKPISTADSQTSHRSGAGNASYLTEGKLSQLLPVGSTKSWTLNSVLHSHRTWQMTMPTGATLSSLTLRVKSSSQNLVSYISRVSTFKEWRPGISQYSIISENKQRQLVKWKQRKLECRLLAQDNVISWWLEPLLEYESTVSRVFLSGAQYSGLIENTESSDTSTAFVCQPIIGLENDQCRLTAITSGDINRLAEECHCLQDHFAIIRAPVEISQLGKSCGMPDQNLAPEEAGISNNARDTFTSDTQPPNERVVFSTSGRRDSLSRDEYSGSDEPRTATDGDRVVNGEIIVGSASGDSTGINHKTPDKSRFEPIQNGEANAMRSPLNRSMTTDNLSARSPSLNINNKSMSLEVGDRVEKVEGYNSVVFLRSLSNENTTAHVDYKTLSNTCAADLLAEVLNATNVVQKPSRERALDTPPLGWVFECTDRDVAVLQKYPPLPTGQSWLGKGLIKQSPDLVWQTVVNPYSRYLYDEILKDLTVICDLGNGMKLLRLLYSTSQVLRKDNREFYVLQAERIENKKKILTLCSFEWPDSELKDCPRGKFETSGWIIEPIVSKNSNKYAMVTYLSHINLVDFTTSGVQQFEEELIIRQPMAIADLRDYLTTDSSK